MARQIANRLTSQWVEQVLNQFNSHTITEKEACGLLDIKRSQFYEIRKKWLKDQLKNREFTLSSSGQG